MFSFCPHCGQTIGGQEQIEGRLLICRYCGKEIGVVTVPKKVVIDETEESIRRGTAACCPVCSQVVEVKAAGTFVPHYAVGQKKICPGSGKRAKPNETAPAIEGGKDVHALMTRDVVKVVLCKGTEQPTIEELILEYQDKADRVRLQIDALRELLGTDFRMKPYPSQLGKADFAIWGNAAALVVARKHDRGGYQPLTDADIEAVVDDLRKNRSAFN